MPGPTPKETRRRRNPPASGEWKPSPGNGWQHGAIPEPPDGLLTVSKETWKLWFQGWWASHWTPNDLPGLGVVIVHFDAVKRSNPAKANDVTALVRLMDTYGITPAGQQARHWSAPKADVEPTAPPATNASPYAALRVIA